MKCVAALSVSALLIMPLAPVAGASVPAQFAMQGRLTDAAGDPLPAGPKTFWLRIFDAETGGTQLWMEGQVANSDANGLWTVNVGASNPFTSQVFADSVRWLEIEVEYEDNPPDILSRIRLISTPYAFRVGTIDGATGGVVTGSVVTGQGHIVSGADVFVAGNGNAINGDQTTVSGGSGNQASGLSAFIGGGIENIADGEGAVVAGGKYNVAGSFDAAISGGRYNEAGDAAFVGGGLGNHADGVQSAIVGGHGNDAAAIGSAVGGGFWNQSLGQYSVVCGGGGFTIVDSNAAHGANAFVGGGARNVAEGDFSVVCGGGGPSGEYNGGNIASGGWSFIGGGCHNKASGTRSVVCGGGGPGLDSNVASGASSFVGSGVNNLASGSLSVVCGGGTAMFTDPNVAGGQASFVGAGYGNRATGDYSVITGGVDNIATGNSSFAAGRNAKARHSYSFIWGDGWDDADSVVSDTHHQFKIRAENGVRFATEAGSTKTIGMGDHYSDNGIVGWGKVRSDGLISSYEFGVASVVHNSTGNYTITLDITASSTNTAIVTVTPEIDIAPTTAAGIRIASVNQLSGNTFDVYINTGAGLAVDNDFMFMVTAR